MNDKSVYSKIKRITDVVLGSVGLVIGLPLWPVIAALIRFDSPGPVFYVQDRVGQDGRVFRIAKFRSMIDEAETNGALWAHVNDKRITRVGRVLRRLHLDELPQLLNVIGGDMSLVGPRPERPEFVSELERVIPGYGRRHAVKPGLTGWAQVNYKYASSLESSRVKLGYDIYYVENKGIALDFEIMLKTVRVIGKE